MINQENISDLTPRTPPKNIGDFGDNRTLSVELNLAKYAPFIFAPSHTKKDVRARVKTWTADPGNGAKVLARILVEPVQGETLNTFDHKTCLALQKFWWEHPKNPQDGTTWMTMKELARTMGLGWGRKTFVQVKASLGRLRKVPITWRYSFFDKASERLMTFEEPLTILDRLRILQAHGRVRTKKQAVKVFKSEGGSVPMYETSGFRFNEYIEKNLARRHTKPIFYEVAMSIRGEIALGLYALLDIIMANKTSWERRVTELLRDDLNIQGTYRWPAEKKRLVERAIGELQGRAVSTGTLDLRVARTKDREDYKLVVKKTPSGVSEKKRVSGATASRDPRKKYLVEQILEVTGDEHSRGYYNKVVRELSEETVWMLLSETKHAHLEGRVQTSKARYFTDLVQRQFAKTAEEMPHGKKGSNSD